MWYVWYKSDVCRERVDTPETYIFHEAQNQESINVTFPNHFAHVN